MNNYIEYFTNYIRMNFDLNNKLIQSKYFHSLRVAYLMAILGKKLGLSDKDITLAYKIGLCHDLGRFYEVVRNGKFNNKIFDHGSYSNKILYNDSFVKYMNIDNEDQLLFRKAIYYHNKKDIGNDLNKRELLFTNMLRDIDKIDLLRVRFNGKRLNFKNMPTNIVLSNYMNGETINLKDLHNDTDRAILYLSFIKNLNFDYSFDLVNEEGDINKLLDIIDIDEKLTSLMDELLNKIKERRNKDVREKVRSYNR